jgi:hypothetical protein
MSGVILEGTMYWNQLVSGTYQGIQKWPGLAKAEVKPNSDIVESVSKDRGLYGTITASVAIAKPSEVSIMLRDVSGQALAMALQGSRSALSYSSGNLTAASFTAKKGAWVELTSGGNPIRNIQTAGFVVKNAADTVTYTAGTDYNVNYNLGLLEIPTASTIVDASTIHVTCTFNAVTGDLVLGSTLANVRGKVWIDGKNLVDGLPCIITFWDALLTADGAIDFMSDKLVELGLKGRAMNVTGKSSPYQLEYGMTFA